jgi:transmembrane 9 superfamily protein 1
MCVQAVEEDWYFQMYYDDLPVWGFIGKVQKDIDEHGDSHFSQYLFNHIEFKIKYNEDKVIEIDVSTNTDMNVNITKGNSEVKVFMSLD